MAPTERPVVSVVWFKFTDLRTHDHEPLSEAHASSHRVLHLFVLDPRWFRTTPLGGFPRTGPRRARFQLQALADLSQRLEAEGHSLCVRRGLSTTAAFEQLCQDFEVKAVYASHEVCSEELRVERAVREVLERQGAGPLRLSWTHELHRYDELPEEVRRKGAAGFSGYRRCFAERCRVRPPLARPELRKTAPGVHWQRAEGLPAGVAELGLGEASEPDPRAEVAWEGGETAALARVRAYLFESDAIAVDYAGATNFPHDGHSLTQEGSLTKLSPWMAHGCISARLLYAELKRYERERHKSDSTARLVHELYFRDFVRFSSLLKGSKIFRLEGIYGRHPPGSWLQDRELLEPWKTGTTGFPFVDAAMRELAATGYCSHAGREVAAWFLICDLGLDWRLGAEWFESVLIDYEPASNWFNWAFTCVPRATGGNSIQEEARPMQPPRTRLQTLEAIYWAAQHDPDGEYIKRWVPELQGLPGSLAREPWRATEHLAMTAERVRGASAEERPPAVARERERIGWARRTFPAGGAEVEVWWTCVRGGAPPKPPQSQPAGQRASPEKRTDPDDGKTYTLKQLQEKYKGQYAPEEVEEYWRDHCKEAEARVDPEDGQAYTLEEMRAKYQGKYKRQEVAEYFRSSCAVSARASAETGGAADGRRQQRWGAAKAAAGACGGGVVAAGAHSWPEGYPLPLLPPASLRGIEDIAEHSRQSQARKAAKADRLRQQWTAASAPRQEEAANAAGASKAPRAKGGQQRSRWARAEGA